MATDTSLFSNLADPTLDRFLGECPQSPVENVNNIDTWINASVGTLYPLSSDATSEATFGGNYSETNLFDDFDTADLILSPFQTIPAQEHAYHGQYEHQTILDDHLPLTMASDQSFPGLSAGVDPTEIKIQKNKGTIVNARDDNRGNVSTKEPQNYDKLCQCRSEPSIFRTASRGARLKHNDAAISKHMQETTDRTPDLGSEGWELNSMLEMLEIYIFMLKNDLLVLKCQCLDYSSCKCERIKEYLHATVVSDPTFLTRASITESLRKRQRRLSLPPLPKQPRYLRSIFSTHLLIFPLKELSWNFGEQILRIVGALAMDLPQGMPKAQVIVLHPLPYQGIIQPPERREVIGDILR
jgi:hypothetical protein